MTDWLPDWLTDFLSWLKDLLLWLPRKLWELLLDGLAALLELIPVPDWLANAGNLFSALPSGVMYFLEPFQIGFGISVFVSAIVIRFLIRRIPVVG